MRRCGVCGEPIYSASRLCVSCREMEPEPRALVWLLYLALVVILGMPVLHVFGLL